MTTEIKDCICEVVRNENGVMMRDGEVVAECPACNTPLPPPENPSFQIQAPPPAPAPSTAQKPKCIMKEFREEDDYRDMKCESCGMRIGAHTIVESRRCGLLEGYTCAICDIEREEGEPEHFWGLDNTPLCSQECFDKIHFYETLREEMRGLKSEPTNRGSPLPRVYTRITLPIKKLCDVPVLAYIERCPFDPVKYILRVVLNTVGDYYNPDIEDDICLYYCFGDYKDIKQKLLMLLDEKERWLDRYYGVIRLGREENTRIQNSRKIRMLFLRAFTPSIGVELMNFEDKNCVACYKPTSGKTECGHSLCVYCLAHWDKETDRVDCDGEVNLETDVDCPMCRQDILHKWSRDDDDGDRF